MRVTPNGSIETNEILLCLILAGLCPKFLARASKPDDVPFGVSLKVDYIQSPAKERRANTLGNGLCGGEW